MNSQIFRRFYSTPILNFYKGQLKKKTYNKEINDKQKESSYIYMYRALIDKSKMVKS
jgi:hypothetical protein